MNGLRRVALAVTSALAILMAGSIPASAAPGDVDQSFGTLGLLTQPQADVDVGVSITRGPQGRFVVAWSADDQVGVSGFLASGEVDGGFGTGGSSAITVPGAFGVDVSNSAVDGSGRTVIVGFLFDTTFKMLVARFTATGHPDTSFSGDGVRKVAFTRGESFAYDVAIRGGKIYLCGQVYTGMSSPADPVVVRLDGAGALDPAFGFGGRRVYKVPDGALGGDFAQSIQPVADGRFVLAGAVDSPQGFNTLVMRIRSDGRLDDTFKGDGYHILNLRKGGSDNVVDMERDGSKLVFGVVGGDLDQPKILRLLANGSRDTTFSGDGVGTYPLFGPSFFRLREIEVDASHRVYAAGFRTNLPAFRVRANGQLATGFGDGGLATNPVTNANVEGMLLRGDVVYVAGVATISDEIHVTRYLV